MLLVNLYISLFVEKWHIRIISGDYTLIENMNKLDVRCVRQPTVNKIRNKKT